MITTDLVRTLERYGAAVTLADKHLTAVKGHCLVQWTEASAWMLFRSAADPRGRFFAEQCTRNEAIRMIRQGEVQRESEALGSREVARRLLSSAIRQSVGAEGPQADQLFEALDLLAG